MLVYLGRMNFAKHAAIHQQRGKGTDVPGDFKVVPEPRFVIKTALENGTYFKSVADRDGNCGRQLVDREDRRIERGRPQLPARTVRYAITFQWNTRESCVELSVLVLIVPSAHRVFAKRNPGKHHTCGAVNDGHLCGSQCFPVVRGESIFLVPQPDTNLSIVVLQPSDLNGQR